MRELHIRFEDDLLEAVASLAARRREAVATVVRRLVKQGVAGEAAADGRAVVARAVQPVIRAELNQWRTLLYRSAFDTAVSGQLMVWLVQEHLAGQQRLEELKAVIADARQRGAERLRRNAESELMTLWETEADPVEMR